MSVLTITRELRLVQNEALGAVLIWRFSCGYTSEHRTSDAAPLPLAFLVPPLIFHRDTYDAIAGTKSGLHAFADKFTRSDNVQTDILLDVHERAIRFRPFCLNALEIAVRKRLVTLLTASGRLAPLSTATPGNVPSSVVPLLANAEKFGKWCAPMSMFEIGTALKLDF